MTLINKQENLLLDSIPRKTLSKEVRNSIIQLLVTGELKPGDKLPTEMELMKMLSVSRNVLREALSSLDSLGIIHRKTRDGTYFSEKIGTQPYSHMLSLAMGDLPTIIEARMALELGLVSLAAEKITEKELDALYKTIEGMSQAPGNYSGFDREFHRIIAFSVNNSVLEGMIDSLLLAFDEMSERTQVRQREIAIEQHMAIYEALKRRSSPEAFSEMYRHLDYVRKKILKNEKAREE